MFTLKQKVVKGAIWTLLEKGSCQIVGFVVGAVLARLLSPSDFGTVAHHYIPLLKSIASS